MYLLTFKKAKTVTFKSGPRNTQELHETPKNALKKTLLGGVYVNSTPF